VTDAAVPQSSAPPAPARWKRLLGCAAGVFLASILLFALYAKVIDPLRLVEQVEQEGLDFLLPAAWVTAIALALEAVLGFALLLGLRRQRVLIPAAGLVAFFLFLTAKAYYLHATGGPEDEASCGCFGSLIERSPAEAFWQDLFLLVPPLALAFLARPALPMRHARQRWVIVGGLSAAVLAFAWVSPGLPIDDFATRLKPGVVAGSLCSGEGDGQICMVDVITDLEEGGHVVLLANIDDAEFHKRLEALNDYALAGEGPMLWVVAPASEEAVELFVQSNQPAFEILPCPPGVIRPLYRTLPRTFHARDGTVVRTWQGWPPLAELAALGAEDADEPEDGADEPVDPRDDDPDGGDGSEEGDR
jgi:uncharacterized membrane protein YphA (DoxX/SURF4 family)